MKSRSVSITSREDKEAEAHMLVFSYFWSSFQLW
jgi:hypothetical protein